MNPELLEKLCVAWWEFEKDGKRVTNCSWEETKPEWRAFYIERILKVIETYEKETKMTREQTKEEITKEYKEAYELSKRYFKNCEPETTACEHTRINMSQDDIKNTIDLVNRPDFKNMIFPEVTPNP